MILCVSVAFYFIWQFKHTLSADLVCVHAHQFCFKKQGPNDFQLGTLEHSDKMLKFHGTFRNKEHSDKILRSNRTLRSTKSLRTLGLSHRPTELLSVFRRSTELKVLLGFADQLNRCSEDQLKCYECSVNKLNYYNCSGVFHGPTELLPVFQSVL